MEAKTSTMKCLKCGQTQEYKNKELIYCTKCGSQYAVKVK